MAEPRFTAKQQRFIEEYLIDYNGTKAARRAGFAPDYAQQQASQMLKMPHIKAEVEKRTKEFAENSFITKERVVSELAKIAFANMYDYMSITNNGDPVVDLSDLDRIEASAIQEFTVDDYVEGRGEEGRDVKRVKIKLYDKRAALNDLGKHLGIFNEQQNNANDNNITINVVRVSKKKDAD